MKFPIAYNTFGDAEKAAVMDCLDRGQTTMGAKVREFEERFAEYVGVSDAVMVNSGSSADLIMMLAARELGILKPGDEILIPAVTWPTQVWAAVEAGFKVRLVDCDPRTLNAVESEGQAVFATHLMGNPSTNLHAPIRFDDCCEALGASVDGRKVGSFALASAFSFFHSHHISTMEGGMITTNDANFAECCRQLRAHGWTRDLKSPPAIQRDSRFTFTARGFNFRPTELQGALGLVQLARLPEFEYWRKKNYEFLTFNLDPAKGNPFLHMRQERYGCIPSPFMLPLVLKENLPYSRQEVFEYLAGYGIETRPLVGGNLARQPAFAAFRNFTVGALPGADCLHDLGFYIGLPPIEADLWGVVNVLQGMHAHLGSGVAA